MDLRLPDNGIMSNAGYFFFTECYSLVTTTGKKVNVSVKSMNCERAQSDKITTEQTNLATLGNSLYVCAEGESSY